MLKCKRCNVKIEPSRNGSRKFCDECSKASKRERDSKRTFKKTCKKCGDSFRGSRERVRCYECNPVIKPNKLDLENLSDSNMIVCIKCNTVKHMPHGNRKICNDCKELSKPKKDIEVEDEYRASINAAFAKYL